MTERGEIPTPPTNLSQFILSLCDSNHNDTNDGDGYGSKYCDLCKDDADSKLEEATHYCVDCEEHFCIACAGFHQKQKISKNHVLTPMEELAKTGTPKKSNKLTSSNKKCEIHNGQVLDSYCETDSEVICLVCFRDHHQQHKVISLENQIEKVKQEIDSSLTEV